MNRSFVLCSLMFILCMLVAIGDCDPRVFKYPNIKKEAVPNKMRSHKDDDSTNLSARRDSRQKSRKGRSAVGPLWPNRTAIPYAFIDIMQFDFEDRALIRSTLREVEEILQINGEDCLTFIERKNEPDYISFVNQGDCSSGIGFVKGVNNISLAEGCRSKGTIIHELMHRLGFDHEHSRHDRDKNIKVIMDNILDSSNYRVNSKNPIYIDVPYDFHSVIHYNSNAFKSGDGPTMLSKVPALVSTKNEIHAARDAMTPIDLFKIQKLYQCKTLSIPDILKESDSIEEERLEKINKRFMMETRFNGVSEALAEKYLDKTYKTCGIDHHWPVDYPIVEDEHQLYKLMCIRKKAPFGRCRFSIECHDEEAFCLRPFFKKRGYCTKFSSETLNSIGQNVNDFMFQAAQKVTDTIRGFFKNKD